MKTININTIVKYLFLTFIITITLICIVDSVITNDSFLLNS